MIINVFNVEQILKIDGLQLRNVAKQVTFKICFKRCPTLRKPRFTVTGRSSREFKKVRGLLQRICRIN